MQSGSPLVPWILISALKTWSELVSFNLGTIRNQGRAAGTQSKQIETGLQTTSPERFKPSFVGQRARVPEYSLPTLGSAALAIWQVDTAARGIIWCDDKVTERVSVGHGHESV